MSTMRFKHIGSKMETWWVPVTIPARDLSGLLSPADQSRYLEFEIIVHVEVAPISDGGLFQYEHEWALPPVGNYPRRIIESIDKYMDSINVEDRFYDAIKSVIWRH